MAVPVRQDIVRWLRRRLVRQLRPRGFARGTLLLAALGVLGAADLPGVPAFCSPASAQPPPALPPGASQAAIAGSGDSATAGAKSTRAAQPELGRPVGFHELFALGTIRTYQKVLSPSKGSHCPMTPHCSKYGFEAFSRYNPIRAFAMTADRLHRCGHDLRYYTPTLVDGQLRFADPLEAPEPTAPGDVDPTMPAALLVLASARTAPESTRTTGSAASPQRVAGDARRLFEFAQSLEIGGDAYRAATEYSRLIHYYPTSERIDDAYAGLARCQYHLGEHLEVIRIAEAYYAAPSRDATDEELRYTMGLSYYQLANYPRARETFAEIVDSGEEPYASKALMLIGRSHALEGDWEASARAFAGVPPDSPFYSYALADREVAMASRSPDRKSPTVAGILSIVPGLGYLYAGYRQTALSAFLVNGAFLWATVESFDSGQNGLGAVLAVLSFGWYSGNVYGSVRSAHRRNEKIEADNLARIQVGFSF